MNGYFEGWYLKHQANGHTLALIPGKSDSAAFIQIITENASHQVDYPLEEYHKGKVLRIGNSVFSQEGIILDIQSDKMHLAGQILYHGLTPIKGDIMGPFRLFPMECRHGVVSMRHNLSGSVTLNGVTLDFSDGVGYIESDSGTSFPSQYVWLHCNDFKKNCSIMASVAQIPLCGLRFWGCICIVWLNGREYRLATYRCVKIKRCDPEDIVLQQGSLKLEITISANSGHTLAAPNNGAMNRTIRESASCPAKFRFSKGSQILFEGTSEHASFEYSKDVNINGGNST